MQNLGGRLVLMLMRADCLVGEVVVVVAGVMVVVVVEKLCLSVTELECLGVGFGLVGGDIFYFGRGFCSDGGGDGGR